MSTQITTSFVKQFERGITTLSQQQGSKLRNAVMLKSGVTGEFAFFDQIDATEAQVVTDRHGDSPLMNTPHARRRVGMTDIEWGDLIDDFDKLKLLNDPTSSYVQNASWAIGRAIDDQIIPAFFADADTGKEGDGSVSFPASNTIAVDFDGDGTGEGLTVDKLREARRILKANEVDIERDSLFIATTAEQDDNLLGTTEVTSADFNTIKALVQGELNTFVGFIFIGTERLETDSNSDRRLPAWAMTGMVLAEAQAPTARITERSDKRFSTYVYYKTSVGSTRLEEDKVVEILCNE